MNVFKKIILLIPFCTCVVSCISTTAIIDKTDGHEIESTIDYSDDKNLYLETYGKNYTIPWDDIIDIDHPGNGATVLTSVLSVCGFSYMFYGFKNNQGKKGVVSGVVSFPIIFMAIEYYKIYSESKNKIFKPHLSNNSTDIFLEPQVALTNVNKYGGLNFYIRF